MVNLDSSPLVREFRCVFYLQMSFILFFRLYTMDGKLVPAPTALQSGNSYVAANKEKFKKCEYFPPQDFNASPRLNRKS